MAERTSQYHHTWLMEKLHWSEHCVVKHVNASLPARTVGSGYRHIGVGRVCKRRMGLFGLVDHGVCVAHVRLLRASVHTRDRERN